MDAQWSIQCVAFKNHICKKKCLIENVLHFSFYPLQYTSLLYLYIASYSSFIVRKKAAAHQLTSCSTGLPFTDWKWNLFKALLFLGRSRRVLNPRIRYILEHWNAFIGKTMLNGQCIKGWCLIIMQNLGVIFPLHKSGRFLVVLLVSSGPRCKSTDWLSDSEVPIRIHDFKFGLAHPRFFHPRRSRGFPVRLFRGHTEKSMSCHTWTFSNMFGWS